MNAAFDLKHLRHFIVLAEELNFTRAAERANLSQTAFSRSIQALEDGLGVRIFDRGTRSVRLTTAGQTLLKRARSMLAQAADLAREVEGLSQATRGKLAFGAGLMAIDGALAGLLPRMRIQSPELRIDVAVGNWRQLQQQLEQERIEFYVGYPGALAEDSDYTTVQLLQEPSSIYCRPHHPLATSATAPSPHQLRGYAWANVATADNLNTRRRALLGFAPDAPLPFMLNCDSQTLLLEAILASDMLLFTWSSWLLAHVRKGSVLDLGSRLVPRVPAPLMRLDCAVVYRTERTLLPAAEELIGMIVDQAGVRRRGKKWLPHDARPTSSLRPPILKEPPACPSPSNPWKPLPPHGTATTSKP